MEMLDPIKAAARAVSEVYYKRELRSTRFLLEELGGCYPEMSQEQIAKVIALAKVRKKLCLIKGKASQQS